MTRSRILDSHPDGIKRLRTEGGHLLRIRSARPPTGNGRSREHEAFATRTGRHAVTQRQQLCARCKELDFDFLFDERERDCDFLMELGSLNPGTSCRLCQLFYAMRVRRRNRKYYSKDQYALFAIKPPAPFWYTKKSFLVVANTSRPGALHASKLRPEGGYIGFISTAASTKVQPNPALPSVHRTSRGVTSVPAGVHPGSLVSRQIRSRSINYDLVRGWIDMCLSRHPKCYAATSALFRLEGLKLIDCYQYPYTIVQPTERVQYAALSYLWGKSGVEHGRPVDGILPRLLPRVIHDTITVTKELGIRYIWIDRYCIDQHDSTERDKQIQQMNYIYQGAFLTLIAAAGKDPHFGLPGVGKQSRPIQPKAQAGPYVVVSTLTDPRHKIRTSPWASRAWTYQEGYFSCRRLIFTDQQVYYECVTGMTVETVDYFFEGEYITDHLFSKNERREQFPWAIANHLGKYGGRTASHDVDIVRALEGVYNHFQQKRFPLDSYFGVPILPAAIRQHHQQEVLQTDESRSEGFARGLCWRNTCPGKRRPSYPTWSWAGWTTPLLGRIPEYDHGLRLLPEDKPRIFAEDANGSLLNLDDPSAYNRAVGAPPDTMSHFIHIEAWTVPLNVQWRAEDLDLKRHLLPRYHWNFFGNFVVFEDGRDTVHAPFYSLRENVINAARRPCAWFDPEERREILGIVLGRFWDESWLRPEGIFILVVWDCGDHFERIGHLELGRYLCREIVMKSSGEAAPWELCFRSRRRRRIRLG